MSRPNLINNKYGPPKRSGRANDKKKNDKHVKKLQWPNSDSESEDGWSNIDDRDAHSATIHGPKHKLPMGADPNARQIAALVGAAAADVGIKAGMAAVQYGFAAGAMGLNVAGGLGKVAIQAVKANFDSRPSTREQARRKLIDQRQKDGPRPAGIYRPRQANRYPNGLTPIKVLGQGGQAYVELWGNASGKEFFAAKTFKAGSRARIYANLEHIILAELNLDNPKANLVKVVGPLLKDTPRRHQYTILMEHCDLGDLNDYHSAMTKLERPVSEECVWNVFSQLASALAYLHTGLGSKDYRKSNKPWVPVVHRDFKPANILLKSRPGSTMPIMKVSDFGLATYKDGDFNANIGLTGTTAYHPPPPKGIIDTPADIWALGAIIHLLCTGDVPLDELKATWADRCRGYQEYFQNVPRKVLDIRQGPDKHHPLNKQRACKKKWIIPYSTDLHSNLMPALEFDSKKRIGALDLHHCIQKTLADRESKMLAEGSIEREEMYKELFRTLKESPESSLTQKSTQDSKPKHDPKASKDPKAIENSRVKDPKIQEVLGLLDKLNFGNFSNQAVTGFAPNDDAEAYNVGDAPAEVETRDDAKA